MTLLLAGKLLAVATGFGPASVTSHFHSSARVGSSVSHRGRSVEGSRTPWPKTFLLQIRGAPPENELWAGSTFSYEACPFSPGCTKPTPLRPARLPALGGCTSPARPAAAPPPPPALLPPSRGRAGRSLPSAGAEGRGRSAGQAAGRLHVCLRAAGGAAGPGKRRRLRSPPGQRGERRVERAEETGRLRGAAAPRVVHPELCCQFESKVGCRAVVARDRGPPWDAGTRRSPSAVGWSAVPACGEPESAVSRPALRGRGRGALAGDVTNCERSGIAEPQGNFFLIPIHWFKP